MAEENREYRVEEDVLGKVKVPQEAYWGKSTQRAINNFQISKKRFPPCFLRSLAQVKKACILANRDLDLLNERIADAMLRAVNEIIEEKKWLDHFPVDVYQTGSGTNTNMNMNEVIANRANELLGSKKGVYRPIHPNDHVNKGQSSNDVIPTTMHLATVSTLRTTLFPAMQNLMDRLAQKIEQFKGIVKVGRTHLQDAVPTTLSLEFQVYKRQLAKAKYRFQDVIEELSEIPLGGTAVGTGITTPESFSKTAIDYLSDITTHLFTANPVKAEGIASHNSIVRTSNVLKELALGLMKMANDVRWLGSGPRAGLGELDLPANESGSSIMPGKVNPTQAESLIQVCLQVLGNNTTVTFGEASGSILDLNVSKPVMSYAVLESIQLLSASMNSFGEKCLHGLQANKQEIAKQVKHNLMKVTNLTPLIGYEKAAEIVHTALKQGKTLEETIETLDIENKEALLKRLDPSTMV